MLDLLNNVSPVGFISNGCYICRRWVLDAICDKKYDEFYNRKLQNELRFATIANMTGAKLGALGNNIIINGTKINKKTYLNNGVGTELKKLLSKIGIKATPNCSCNARAKIMDAKGIEWCKENIDIIVGWLKEEAAKRNLPFMEMAGKLLVKRAIKNATKNATKNSNGTST